MRLEKQSACKVNLILNILGKRPDGFHDLETVMQRVAVFDTICFERAGAQLELSCSDRALPTDSRNLVHRAATAFLQQAKIADGVRLHLEKRIPLAAGLGGGSGNAATTLLGLNELFGRPLSDQQLYSIAASLGSDIPFFLQDKPALATGRGEKIQALQPFACLSNATVILVHPGFGISTPWAYQQLARFPAALNGTPGRAQKLISLLNQGGLRTASTECYNSLEAPALEKYPLLFLFQEFFREQSAAATLMSGSGSSTFAIFEDHRRAAEAAAQFVTQFGAHNWVAVVPFA